MNVKITNEVNDIRLVLNECCEDYGYKEVWISKSSIVKKGISKDGKIIYLHLANGDVEMFSILKIKSIRKCLIISEVEGVVPIDIDHLVKLISKYM